MKYSISLLLAISILSSSCNSIKNNKSTSYDSISVIDIEVDKLGYYYTINSEGKVTKYDEDKPLYTYSNSNIGQLAVLDVTNPQKIILFYRDQQTIVLLDNSLSEIGTIVLNNNSFFSALGMANDGNIWLYDSFLDKLIKIDNNGFKIDESFPIDNINPENIISAKIIDRSNHVIIADKNKGLLLFNNMGFYEKSFPIKNISKPTIVNNSMYYFDKSKNCYISKKLNVFSEDYQLCFEKYNMHPNIVIFENAKFYILKNNKVQTFSSKYFKREQ